MRDQLNLREAFQPGGLLWNETSGISFASRAPNSQARILAKGPRAAARIAKKTSKAATVAIVDRQRIDHASSLEQLQGYLGHGEILYDPSGVGTRTAVTLELIRGLSARLGSRLRVALLDAERRKIVCILDRPGGKAREVNLRLAEAQQALRSLPRSELDADGFRPSVVFTFSLPAGRYIPVDRRSARRLWRQRFARRTRNMVAYTGAAASLLSHSVAGAQQVAGQFGGMGGVSQGDEVGAGQASLAIQGPEIGAQVDGTIGSIDGGTFGEVIGHLFHRDPGTGLIGVTARWNDLNGPERWQVGVEAERYIDRFTLVGEVGYEDSDLRNGDIYGVAGFGYYPTDTTSIYLVGAYTLGEPIAQASFEIQPAAGALPGLSLFADGGIGVSGDGFAVAGVRFTFGARGSLIKRDRESLIRRKINALALDSSS